MTTKVEPRHAGEWVVQVTRAHGDRSSDGTAVSRGAARASAESGPAVALAGSRAWLALGTSNIDQERFDDAIACARAGLTELGSDYAPRDAVDDTGLKLLAAEDLIQNGEAAKGARTMLRMLEARTRLYARRHADVIVE
jgi:hypothetical protein